MANEEIILGLSEEQEYTKIGHLVDLKDSEKNKEKKSSAIKHLDYYLSRQKTFPFKNHKEMTLKDINDYFCGNFATYLVKYAHMYCNVNKPLLKYLTAHGYMSAFKMYFEGAYREEMSPMCFEPLKWRKYLQSIYKEKAQQAREGGYVRFVIFLKAGGCSPFLSYLI